MMSDTRLNPPGDNYPELVDNSGRWDAAEQDADAFMTRLLTNMKDLRSEHETLRRAYMRLRDDYAQLRQAYEDDKQSWRKFLDWYEDKKAKQKKRLVDVCGDEGSSSPAPSTGSAKKPRIFVAAESSKMAKEEIPTPPVREIRTPLRPKTINAEFEIDPAMNGNKSYLHKDVVRNKVKRKQMHAHDCPCCRDWYDAVGPVAVRPYEEVKENRKLEPDANANATLEQRQAHLQRTSRHRDYGPPPSTPPGFWDIGFPSTQRVIELNKTADEAERKRKERIRADPRFRRRSDMV